MTSEEQEPDTLEMVEATVEDLTEVEEEEEEETTEAEESNAPNDVIKHAVFNKYETVYDATFDELHLPAEVCEEMRQTWQALISKMGSREAVGEAIYDTIMDEAPGLKQFFKSPKSVFALRFSNGMNSMLSELDSPSSFKKVVETYGFMHLDFAVTVPRVELVREAIISVADMELGGSFTDRSRQCFTLLLNYIGGAFVFVLRELADRIRIIQRSWQQVNKKETLENALLPEGADKDPRKPEEEGEESSPQADNNANKDSKKARVQTKPNPDQEQQRSSFMVGAKNNKNPAMQVPTDFSGMFMFNAAVMGFAETAWMNLVLDRFDNIASNIANTSRVQEECFVLSLCLAKLPDPSSLSLPDFRAVMLAALRSLIPDEWDMNHEVAWNWLWENVERVVSSTVPLPQPYEKAVRSFMFGLQEEQLQTIRIKTYADFFTRCPAGQEYFKQSTTRLYFILDKINEMTVEMFASPLKLVEDISALGLRHVGYGVPIELIPTFVACVSDTIAEFTTDDMAPKAYSWCLTLISKILSRVIMEGSTVVMKAINTNSEVELKKAISLAPRGQRARQLLEVSVGTQSISPLYWAIDSGSLSVANAIIEDLLIIRADRDVYYYGCDALFTRHPEVIHRICNSAPTLLSPLFDGLIWRSRLTSHGFRRVNYYVKHLIQDADGNFNQALQWLCTHGDAKITSHPVVCLAADTVWFRFAVFYFILGRFYFLLTALVFATSQAFLFHHDYKETFEENIVTLCCRVFIYLGCLPSMMFNLTRKLYGDFKQGSVTRVCGCCPMPDSLRSFQVVGQLGLMWTFVFMFALEPITYCVNSRAASNYELFSVLCPEGQQIMDVYSILSSIALLIYWFLLTDFSLLSMRVSAFLLVCFYLISEVVLFVLALTFLILAFSTAISALNHHIEDFETVPAWMRALLQISLGMFPNTHYDDFQVEVTVLVAISVFVALVFIFLVNLLIAQLNQAYHNMFEDIYGNARLTRAAVIVQVMAQVPRKRWQNFLKRLAFDQPLEFNEGDVGIAGGIQILEPASAKIVTSDAVKRYGGSTAPTMPWPVEETANLTDEDRFDRLEKMIAKVTSARGKDRRRGGSAAGSKASHLGSSMGSSNASS